MSIGEITVVNKHTYRGKSTGVVYIGRGSVFGNPYPLPKYTREASIAKYKKDFLVLMTWESPMKIALRKIAQEILHGRDVKLMCYCAPRACHGDVLKQYIDEAIAKRLNQ